MSTFNWSEFVSFGDRVQGLESLKKSKCLIRIAISRVYYGVFHQAKSKIGNHLYRKEPRNGEYYNHSEVYKFMKDYDEGSIVGDLLLNLYNLRVQADYKQNVELDSKDLDMALAYSRNILSRLTQLDRTPWNG